MRERIAMSSEDERSLEAVARAFPEYRFVAERAAAPALRTARDWRRERPAGGVIVFHARNLVADGVRTFLSELPPGFHAYPLRHDLLVVESGVPSLLADPAVRAQVAHRGWLVADRFKLVPLALRLAKWRLALQRLARSARRAALRLWSRRPTRKPPLYLAVCAIFRDEARYLPE